jgi:hypothetical protein
MVHQEAISEARRWLDELNLPYQSGRVIDLREPAKQVKYVGSFRTLFFQQAVRLLSREGASVIPPEP